MADMHDGVAASLSSLVACCPRAARRHRRKVYPAPDPGAGAGVKGGTSNRNRSERFRQSRCFLRDANRARAFGCGIEEVVSDVIAFCRESTRATSEES